MGLGNIGFNAVVIRKRGVATELDQMKHMALKEARRLVTSAQLIHEAIGIGDYSGVVDEATQLKIAADGVAGRAEKIKSMQKLTYKR